MNVRKSSGQSTKTQTKGNTKPVAVSFGVRRVTKNNFSKTITLPATALENLGTRSKNLKVELVQEKGERYIKLSPVKGGKK